MKNECAETYHNGLIRGKNEFAGFAFAHFSIQREDYGFHFYYIQEWLPSSGYRRAEESVPDIEVYPEPDMPKANFKYELWFPVVKE